MVTNRDEAPDCPTGPGENFLGGTLSIRTFFMRSGLNFRRSASKLASAGQITSTIHSGSGYDVLCFQSLIIKWPIKNRDDHSGVGGEGRVFCAVDPLLLEFFCTFFNSSKKKSMLTVLYMYQYTSLPPKITTTSLHSPRITTGNATHLFKQHMNHPENIFHTRRRNFRNCF